MPYLNSKGYCRECKRITSHRFSLMIKCYNCGLESTQKEHLQGEKEKEIKK